MSGQAPLRTYAARMPEWITPALTLGGLALLVSVAAGLYARRATLAAESSAAQAQRANDLLEQQIRDEQAREEERRQAEAVQWAIERDGDLLYLRNTGRETAHAVRVIFDDEVMAELAQQVPQGDLALEPGQAAEMLITEYWGGPALSELAVEWQGCTRRVYVRVPPKPPKAQ